MKLIDKYVDVLERHYESMYPWSYRSLYELLVDNAPLYDPSKEVSISQINSAFNKLITYKSDRWVQGNPPRWMTPSEAMYKGSDCEEYALAKGLAKKELDSDSKVWFWIVKDKWLTHAVCVIDDYVLDIPSKSPSSPFKRSKYEIYGIYKWTGPRVYIPSRKEWREIKESSTDPGFVLKNM